MTPLVSRPEKADNPTQLLTAIMESVTEGIITIDERGIIEMVNPAAERMFGYSPGELVRKNIEVLVPEPHRGRHDEFLSRFLETGATKTPGPVRETEACRKDGSVFPVSVAVSRFEIGGRLKVVGVFRDISERKRMLANLVESEARSRDMAILQAAVLDGANYSIIATFPDGIIRSFNAVAQRWLGYSAEEVVGKVTPEIFHDPVELARYAEELSKELGRPIHPGFEVFAAKARQGSPVEREWTYVRKDGSRFPVLLSLTPLLDADGVITGFLGIAGDITDRKRADEALARLASIVESSDDAIIGKSLDGVVLSWNKGAERLYGYRASEMLGRPISVLTPPGRSDELDGILDRIRRGERVEHFETLRIGKDGRAIDVSLTVSPITDPAGRICGVSAIARDITGRKKAEEQLRRLSMAVEQSPVSVVITDITGRIEYVNPKFTEVTGYSSEEAIGQNPRILKSGDKPPSEYKKLWETITAGGEWRGEFHNKKKNGELYWESASISPIKDDKGNITHFIAVKEDITSLKEAREELAKLSLVASKTDNAVIITDAEGVIEWVNDGFVRLTGYTLPEVVGRKPGSVLQGPLTDRLTVQRIREFLKARVPFTEEILNYHKEGFPYWVSMNVTPIFDDSGRLIRFISIESDVTERRHAEEALRKAKEAADAASRAKTEFLSSMSHEIRTPMNAIVGMAELLWESPLNDEQRKYVQMFRSAGDTLLNLINDILDLSKVESGQIELEAIPFDLAEVIDRTCEVMAVRAHEKGLELACRIMPGLPTHLVGDPGRLRQVLTNLIGNALKFTEQGEIVVEVKCRDLGGAGCTGDGGRQRDLLFSVRDTGIGIEPEKQEVIFEKFAQADTSITRKYGGTGLGLAITRKLVELMGGKIWVESKVGEGTTFSFSIRFDEAPAPVPKEPLSEVDLAGVRVLVIDDNSTNRLILRETLSRWGAPVFAVGSGEEGIAELQKAKEAGNPYRLVLLDQRMPEMDGFRVAERIKNLPDLAGTAVIMLTSDGMSLATGRSRELGIVSCLTKPVKQSELREAINLTLGRFVPPAPRETPPAPEGLGTLNILLVEDSSANRFLIQAFLKNTGCRIDTAENGQIAVEKFLSNRYDLVIMDMQMPVMDGYTATRTIRSIEKEEGLAPVPIVALTAHALKEDVQKSLDAGCDAHLNKPIKKAELIGAIMGYLKGPPPRP